MEGLVKLLERSLSDPRRLRALLRFQSAVLTHQALTGEPGKFSFEPATGPPPMFQAFPLQMSLPALAVEGCRRREPISDPERWRPLVFARQGARGGNLDRAGLAPAEMKLHTLLDGTQPLGAVAEKAGLSLADAAAVARGLELAGLIERRQPAQTASILILDDDPETLQIAQRVLGAEGESYQVKGVRDRVGAQLLLRRTPFDLVILPLDRAEHETFFRTVREQVPASTRFVGIVGITEEGEFNRLDAMGLDGVLHRPLAEADLKATAKHLLLKEDGLAVAS
jgi:CheY-like chemotaxis protein